MKILVIEDEKLLAESLKTLLENKGFQVARRVRSKRCATPILMLTAKSDTESRIAGLNAGALDIDRGFLLRNSQGQQPQSLAAKLPVHPADKVQQGIPAFKGTGKHISGLDTGEGRAQLRMM